MKLHVETVHEGKKPFQCDFCTARFPQKSQLKNHTESVHRRIPNQTAMDESFDSNLEENFFETHQDENISKLNEYIDETRSGM